MQEQPLVSIVIVTYNSGRFVEETLDSIYRQSYPRMELIVSDDGSGDNTVALCRDWLAAHQDRFASTTLLTAKRNRGIAANLNRGERAAQGKYLKSLAGDDLLTDDAIARYVAHMQRHPEITYLFGLVQAFGNDRQAIDVVHQAQADGQRFYQLSPREQLPLLLEADCCILAPAFFYDRERNAKLDIRCDESIPLLEDWPRWIRISRRRQQLYRMEEVTVRYRIHDQSVSNSTPENKRRFTAARCQVWTKYQFGHYFRKQPRLALIKYIKMKRYITDRKLWQLLELLGRALDVPYRKLRHSSVNDWDGNYIY